jgi:hypothetical protein
VALLFVPPKDELEISRKEEVLIGIFAASQSFPLAVGLPHAHHHPPTPPAEACSTASSDFSKMQTT